MGGGGHIGAQCPAVLDQGNGQRRALGRVGTGAQFIKEHQGLSVALADDLHNVSHMRRKGGQGLLNGLLVADIGQHPVIKGNTAAVVRRNVHAALGHQGEKPHGLEGDGLTAGVGAGDDHGVKVVAQAHGDGHHSLLINQGMAGIFELDLPVLPDLGLHSLHLKAQLCPGEDHIQPHQDFKVLVDILLVAGGLGGELGQNPLDLLALLGKELPQVVICIDRLHGLDEKGIARGGNIVHQAGNGGFTFTLHWHHKPIRADGDDGFPEVLGIGGRGDDLLERFPHRRALDADMAADIGQLRTGGVGDLLLGENGALDLFLQILVGHQLQEQRIEHRGHRIGLGIVFHLPGTAQHRRDF